MKRLIASLGTAILSLATFTAAQADTVVNVTQYSYNYNNQVVCTAVRMNPATFGALSSDACTPMTSVGSNGPDRITANIYDSAGQLTAIEQAYGTSNVRVYASYTYTNNGLKKTETDANNNKTTFTYDGFDRLITLQYPNTALSAGTSSTTDYEAFTYDTNNNRKTWRRRNGQTITYTYDNLNREVIADIPAHPGGAYNATEKDIYTTYDAFGRVLKKAFASYTGTGVSYTYNGLGWVATTTDMSNRTLTYLYNAAGARVQMTDPNGYYVVYGLDNLNRVQKATLNGTTNVLYSYTYNAIGQRTLLTKGAATTGGGTTTYAYDNLGRLQGMAVDQATNGYDITWGKVGTVGAVAYNAANQITTWASNNTTFDYVEITTAAENRAFDGLNRDAAIAAVSGGYDASGNLTKDTPRSFIYDIYNRLLTATGGASNFSMSYDPEGRLVNITTATDDRDFLYDGSDLIAEYIGASATPASRYIHGGGANDPIVWLKGADDSDRRYYYTNYQGSILGYVGAAGQFVLGSLIKYGPYGEPRNSANAEVWSGARFGYTGQMTLSNAALYYYKARVYDPKFGRFLQTDPVGSKDDLDLYAYVGGDPVNRSDPTGTQYVGPLEQPKQDQNPPPPPPRGFKLTDILKGIKSVVSGIAPPTHSQPDPVQSGTYHLKQGVPEPSPAVANLLQCTANCTGQDIRVTETSGNHKDTDPHTRGLAVDITTPYPAATMQCAAHCGAAYQQNEYSNPSPNATGGHVHLQIPPGRGGATGPYHKDDVDDPN